MIRHWWVTSWRNAVFILHITNEREACVCPCCVALRTVKLSLYCHAAAPLPPVRLRAVCPPASSVLPCQNANRLVCCRRRLASSRRLRRDAFAATPSSQCQRLISKCLPLRRYTRRLTALDAQRARLARAVSDFPRRRRRPVQGNPRLA